MPGESFLSSVNIHRIIDTCSVMNGLTAIKRIRDMEGSGVKQLVIALTGNARQGQINQALDAGMDEGEYRESVSLHSLAVVLIGDQSSSNPTS